MNAQPTNRWFTNVARAILASLLLGMTSVSNATHSITYYHWDALGSPVAATDEAGNVKWREQYEPYGERIQNQPQANTNSRWYTGHPHDEATGLTYMGARWYDPVVGRFYGVDAVGYVVGDSASFNRYAYAGNNPYTYVDPDGNFKIGIPFTNTYFVMQQNPSGGYRAYITTPAEGRYIDPAPTGLFSAPQITFQNDDPNGASPDQKVHFGTADMIEHTVSETGQTININSSARSGPNQLRHGTAQAVDVNRINGKAVSDPTNSSEVEKYQRALDRQPNIRENFGPAFKHKTMPGVGRNNNWPVSGHGDHVHGSSND